MLSVMLVPHIGIHLSHAFSSTKHIIASANESMNPYASR
jgi:hypothetical protein